MNNSYKFTVLYCKWAIDWDEYIWIW